MRAAEAFLDRAELTALQESRLAELLDEVLPRNPFYAEKFKAAAVRRADVRKLADLKRLPCTTKAELLADQIAHPPYGSNLTYPVAQYTRMHQTSGSTSLPLRWLDTASSWERMLSCWQTIFDITGITTADRLFFAFSFGPFLGFWTAFEAGQRRGCLCLAGGGLSSVARLNMLLDHSATLVFCTPTYALRLAETAREHGIELSKANSRYSIRALIVAGEPGGCIPATRARIEDAWQARVFDHSGMTEVGPLAIECPEGPGGLHILEGDYWAEIVDPTSEQMVAAGSTGELVLTTLGRVGSPLLRYRTGDLVRLDDGPCPCGRTFLRLAGGILGRADKMIHVRGNNIYPAALENIIRRFREVAEFRIVVSEQAHMTELRIEIEPECAGANLPERIGQVIRDELLFRADVVLVKSLPRFEMKASRVIQTGPG
ncbi:MAG: phenylacetate--CoA ligase [Planctomycetes bacterium]|nr:phenylacetate--CoA ligase [Planctomycetota bacterium]